MISRRTFIGGCVAAGAGAALPGVKCNCADTPSEYTVSFSSVLNPTIDNKWLVILHTVKYRSGIEPAIDNLKRRWAQHTGRIVG
jgi:TAT (twin-arginine translocation) pathway signal sequence